MRYVPLLALLAAGCCPSATEPPQAPEVVYVPLPPKLVEVEVAKLWCCPNCGRCSDGTRKEVAPLPPKLNPPQKSLCSDKCTCGCNAGQVCRCNSSAPANASRPIATPSSGCYIDAAGRQVCPLKR